eukprot:TRINITY_DN9691_c0_g1_i2.p2 TRINITY_DN9691_c0_g1~~TRINITY_DN9691_c0_g1_i2.p2  ORF type:complete len:184 (+),score=55.03 TRINITY_DN9691_c0_g1_i2:113-664(+)
MCIRDSSQSLEFKFSRVPFLLRPERKRRMVWGNVLRDDLRKPRSWFEGMQAMGAPLGITFDFEGEVGNSLDSLRLLMWAGTQDKQEELAGILAEGHFQQRRSVADHGVLLDACESAGLSREAAAEVLDSESFGKEVMEQYEDIQGQGVHSIPLFIFDNKWTTSGTRSVEDYVELVKTIERHYA